MLLTAHRLKVLLPHADLCRDVRADRGSGRFIRHAPHPRVLGSHGVLLLLREGRERDASDGLIGQPLGFEGIVNDFAACLLVFGHQFAHEKHLDSGGRVLLGTLVIARQFLLT